MQVKVGSTLNSISLRGVDYPVVGGLATIPDDYLPDLLKVCPWAEEQTGYVGNPPPPTPATDGRNKV